MMRIVQDDLTDRRVLDLLDVHWGAARRETAPGSAHVLDAARLRSPDIRFWTIWDEEALLGCGALQQLSPDHGEVKSMHSAQACHIIDTARASGMSRLSLETGSWEYFRAAREFYRSHGFVECAPFADYVLDPNSIFMSRKL
jgi:putative acetyltransferase